MQCSAGDVINNDENGGFRELDAGAPKTGGSINVRGENSSIGRMVSSTATERESWTNRHWAK